MKCDNCGTDNRKKAKFCKSCGEKIGRNIAPEAAARQPAGRKGLLMGIGGAAARSPRRRGPSSFAIARRRRSISSDASTPP